VRYGVLMNHSDKPSTVTITFPFLPNRSVGGGAFFENSGDDPVTSAFATGIAASRQLQISQRAFSVKRCVCIDQELGPCRCSRSGRSITHRPTAEGGARASWSANAGCSRPGPSAKAKPLYSGTWTSDPAVRQQTFAAGKFVYRSRTVYRTSRASLRHGAAKGPRETRDGWRDQALIVPVYCVPTTCCAGCKIAGETAANNRGML